MVFTMIEKGKLNNCQKIIEKISKKYLKTVDKGFFMWYNGIAIKGCDQRKVERQRSKIMEYTFIYKFETNQYGDEYDYDEFR